MMNINYKEDFKLRVRMMDVFEQYTAIPDFDFDIALIAGGRKFHAGRENGELYNCEIAADDPGSLIIIADNHGLFPCKALIAEIAFHVPDATYPDGVHEMVRKYDTGIALTVADSDLPCDCKFTAILPYIKGEKGDKGEPGESINWDELSEEERERIARAVAEEIGEEIAAPETITDEDIEKLWSLAEGSADIV